MRFLIVGCLLLAAAGSASAAACAYLQDKYLLSVVENSPLGTLIQVLEKTSAMSTDTFSIEDQRPQPFPFEVIMTPNITFNVTGSLDREAQFAYSCSLRCVSTGDPATAGARTVLIVISVNDVDDVAPVWAAGDYEASVNEGTPIGTQLTFIGQRPMISDGDQSSSQRLEIRIVPGLYSNLFRLQAQVTTAPVILTNKVFDTEAQSSYVIELEYLDYETATGALKFNGTKNLTIKINDLEDEPPKWEHNLYTTEVNSQPKKGRVLTFKPANLKAIDGDTGINATIHYALPAGFTTIVDVNLTTAALTLNQDNPQPQLYQLYVKAFEADNPKREAFVLVKIEIKSSTVHPLCRTPILKVSLPEDTPANSRIVDININYPLNSATLQYTVLTHASLFSVSGGWLVLLQKVDYEARSAIYNVSVKVSDGIKPATCHFEIMPTNVNDNDPKFSLGEYEFKPVSKAKDLTVGSVKATDRDGDTVTYSLKQALVFSINSITGVITLNASTEKYTKDTYSFLAVANDNASPTSREGQVLVKVTFVTSAVSTANTLVVAMAVLGGLLVMVLVVAAIVFILYRKRVLVLEEKLSQTLANISDSGRSQWRDQPVLLRESRHNRPSRGCMDQCSVSPGGNA